MITCAESCCLLPRLDRVHNRRLARCRAASCGVRLLVATCSTGHQQVGTLLAQICGNQHDAQTESMPTASHPADRGSCAAAGDHSRAGGPSQSTRQARHLGPRVDLFRKVTEAPIKPIRPQERHLSGHFCGRTSKLKPAKLCLIELVINPEAADFATAVSGHGLHDHNLIGRCVSCISRELRAHARLLCRRT